MKIFAHATYVGDSGYNAHCQNFFKTLSKNNDLKIRNFTVSKNWNPEDKKNPHGPDVSELDKILICKQTLWSNDVLVDYDIYDGIKNFTPDVNIVLAEVNHHYFYNKYNGPKIAYTVWESSSYPQHFFDVLKTFDQVWVPSSWQAEITINQGIEKEKVKVVPEGVDDLLFYPEEIKYDDDKFRFLIFGRWDDRKSIKELVQAFKNVFGNSDKVELIISADNIYSIDGMSSTEERLKFYNLDSSNIKVLHFPSKQEYAKYLKMGHVFLSCSRSEGWNLPLIEAMACGIPCIYSDCSGQLEYATGKGIPVKILKEQSASSVSNSFCKYKNVDHGNWYEPDFKDLEAKILEVYQNYNKYREKALEESIEIRREFTWENAAKKANLILKDLFEKKECTNYLVNFLGYTDDKLGIKYNASTEEDVKINIKITDEFTGFIFHDEDLFINNKCWFFTKHAYLLPNQIFRIYDYETNELKLEIKTNTDLVLDEIKIKKENKNLISLIPDSLKSSKYLGFSFFEIFSRETYRFKKCKIEKGDVVFDIGSCFGFFSRYAFQNGASQVHAFEANPDLTSIYKSLNEGFNYFYSYGAVYSRPVKFLLSKDFVGSRVEEDSNLGSNINLNNYIKTANISRIDYLKIDIEGAEYDLFETIDEEFLENKVKKIAIEYHFNENQKINIILNKLKKCGFSFEFELSDGEFRNMGMLYAWKNISFDFENFFSKYKEGIMKSGKSRAKFYEYIIPKLVAKNKPVFILETGTMWEPFETNSGAFTLIMADLIKNVTGGKLYTVDISQESINKCKKNTQGFHDAIEFIQSDSVNYIKSLPDEFVSKLDLVYLDSYDFSFPNPHPSAQHHLEELNAIYNRINDDCGIGIDDNFLPNCWVQWNHFDSNGSIIKSEKFDVVDKPRGKAEYCHPKLISKGWRRFIEFDDYPNSNLFYYERSKFSVSQVNKILEDFYNKNNQSKPKTNKFLTFKNITNSANGLGDTIILNNLCEFKFINSSFSDFNTLIKYNNKYKTPNTEDFFDINNSGYNDFDWGGGHCIQRLEQAFIGKKSKIPKPYISKQYAPIKNRILIHLDGKTNHLDNQIKNKIINFLEKNNYTLCYWNEKDLEESIELASSCEYFIGVNSGPMHVAAAFGIKSIVILNREDSNKIYLPKLSELDIPESEWLYPQNIHLSIANDNELIEKFTLENLRRALAGNLYPYFSECFILNQNNEKDKEVSIINESGSLGDTLAWVPIVNEFAKEKKIKVNLYTPYKDLFSDQYPLINFYNYSDEKKSPSCIKIGCFDDFSYRNLSLQEIACKCLGILNREVFPVLNINNSKTKEIKKKYVCIAIQSTAQCKYWNNKTGWHQVVNYLRELDYEVICIDRYSSFGTQSNMNLMPENCVDKTGDFPLEDRINDILNCDFFIGISSGLSWLAWACRKPVVLISGFTNPKTEFYTKYRVFNKNVCNSCWNDESLYFDKNNWMWCPKDKNFECSKEITFEMVKDKINECIKDLNYKKENFPLNV